MATRAQRRAGNGSVMLRWPASCSRAIVPGLCAAVLTLLAVGAPPAGAVTATITDVNPDASTNGNPNASTGGRINAGLASVSGDNRTFYAASEFGGVFKTRDAGATWRHLDDHLPTVAWDVEVDPASNDVVYATSWYDGRTNPLSGIEVSRDAGTTWTRPATSYPDPALEGTASDNTPPGFDCQDSFFRVEPSAFGIGIRPDASGNVFVGTACGVARTTDAGVTWQFIDPTPATPARKVWDVVVQAGGPAGQGIVDVCGDDGHHRSTDGGATWTGGSGALPAGRCSIAASPDESYVLFVVAADNNLYESDDGGASWTNLGNRAPGGRIPFVVTNQRANAGATNRFDLWYSDTSLFVAECVTPAAPSPGGASRCPLSASWLDRQAGAHLDAGDLVFDTGVSVDACPRIYSTDGGAHTNTVTTSPACHETIWNRSNAGLHALWLWTMDGADQPGSATEDLYFGTQDNGTFATRDASSNPPAWTNPNCCDTFDVLASPDWVLGTVCCFGGGLRSNQLELAAPGYVGQAQIVPYPPGDLRGFTFEHRFDQFGPNAVVIITTAGVFTTADITASPITWSPLTSTPFAPADACGVQASRSGTTPVFYVQVGSCRGSGLDAVFRHTGTGSSGAWTRVDNTDGLGGGFGVFAADPNDADRLLASDLGGPGRMVFSDDGAATWHNSVNLNQRMVGEGAFKFRNAVGPTEFSLFSGYAQPSLLEFDPEDGSIVVAGGQDSGVFISFDGGGQWELLTDPFDSGDSGVPHIPRPRYAYFDHEPAGTVSVYVGSQGRGVWRISATIPVNQPPDCSSVSPDLTRLRPPNGRFMTVSLRGGSDPDGEDVALVVTGVTQDEGLGSRRPDAKHGSRSHQVLLRAERDGGGDGRVYRIAFEGSDGKGGTCAGTVSVGVPHDSSKRSVVRDSGRSFNSFGP